MKALNARLQLLLDILGTLELRSSVIQDHVKLLKPVYDGADQLELTAADMKAAAKALRRYLRSMGFRVGSGTNKKSYALSPPARCLAQDCELNARTNGLCREHFNKMKTDRAQRIQCGVQDCLNLIQTRRVCALHYQRARNAGLLSQGKKADLVLLIDELEKGSGSPLSKVEGQL